MDQKEGKEEQADGGRGGEMQSAAVSAEKKGEPGDPPPTAAQVRVRSSVCSCFPSLASIASFPVCVNCGQLLQRSKFFCAFV